MYCISILGIVKSPLGGDFLTMQCKALLDNKDIEVVPPYMIAGKEVVKDFEKPKWTRKNNIPEVTKSWHTYVTKASGIYFYLVNYYCGFLIIEIVQINYRRW